MSAENPKPAGLFSRVEINKKAIVLSACLSTLGVLGTCGIKVVCDTVLKNQSEYTLELIAIGLALVVVLGYWWRNARYIIVDTILTKDASQEAKNLFSRIMGARLDKAPGVQISSSAMQQLEVARQGKGPAITFSIADAGFAIISLIVLALMSGPLVMVPIMAASVLVLSSMRMERRLKAAASNQSRMQIAATQHMEESVNALHDIKLLGAEGYQTKRFDNLATAEAKARSELRWIQQQGVNLSQAICTAAQWGTMLFGALMAFKGTLTPGGLMASSMLSGLAIAPMAPVMAALTALARACAAQENLIGPVMSVEQEDSNTGSPLPSNNFDVHFDSVSFAYPGSEHMALNNISLQIEGGQKIALMGGIGAGKSTIAHLLAGLHKPTFGLVTIGGVSVTHVSPLDLRKHVFVLPQHPHMITGTLQDNLYLGLQERPSSDGLAAVLEMSGINAWLKDVPEGLGYRIDGRGRPNLSAGQVQTIALARGMLRHPKIIVMDEPTAALSPDAITGFVSRIAPWIEDKTLIVITHTPSVANKLCDWNYNINHGRIGPKLPTTNKRKAA